MSPLHATTVANRLLPEALDRYVPHCMPQPSPTPIAPSRAAGLEYLVPQTDRPKPRRRPRVPTPKRGTTLAFPSDEQIRSKFWGAAGEFAAGVLDPAAPRSTAVTRSWVAKSSNSTMSKEDQESPKGPASVAGPFPTHSSSLPWPNPPYRPNHIKTCLKSSFSIYVTFNF